jgi:hypothetical protein
MKTSQVIAVINEDLKKKFKKKCIDENKTQQKILGELISKFVKGK